MLQRIEQELKEISRIVSEEEEDEKVTPLITRTKEEAQKISLKVEESFLANKQNETNLCLKGLVEKVNGSLGIDDLEYIDS